MKVFTNIVCMLPTGVSCTLAAAIYYQSYAGSHSSSSFPGYSDSFFSGRLSDQGTISRETISQHRCSHQTVSLSWVSYLMEKVRPNSFSGLHLSNQTFPCKSGLSSSSTGKVPESLFESHLFLYHNW